MKCLESNGAETEAFLGALRAAAVRDRIPLNGSIELTRRCNLGCIHCYAKGPEGAGGRRELSMDEIGSVIDQLVEAGCLELTLTGGEPMLRPDFPEIYGRARRAGVLVTVFTNGTLVDERILGVFRQWPPNRVEITVYGATRETYEQITGVPGSHRQCMEGIRRIRELGIPLTLKTVLMTLNREEFSAIEAMARSLGAGFRFDAFIFPRFSGDASPTRFRVPAAEAVDLDFSSPTRRREWDVISKRDGTPGNSDRLFVCQAARTHFHVTATGWLQPCLMASNLQYDLLEARFREGWKAMGDAVAEKTLDESNACRHCTAWSLCLNCPGHALIESGGCADISPYLCELARLRERFLKGP